MSTKHTAPWPIGRDAFQREVGAWAEATFPQSSAGSVVAHLRREVDELAASAHLGPPEDEEREAADCFLLLLHFAHKRGFSLLAAAHEKFAAHRARRWGEPDAAGVVEHVREEEARRGEHGHGRRGAGAAEVAAIRERWARAAPGPWEYVTDGGGRHAIDDDHGVIADLGNRVRTDRTQRVSDARAIAAAPTDIAALLALVDALTGALAEAEAARAADAADAAVRAAAEAFYAAHQEAWIPDEQRTRVALFAVLDARRAATTTEEDARDGD